MSAHGAEHGGGFHISTETKRRGAGFLVGLGMIAANFPVAAGLILGGATYLIFKLSAGHGGH